MELIDHPFMGYFVYIVMVGGMWLASQSLGSGDDA